MVADVETKQLKELREISDDMGVLRKQTTLRASFVRGLVQGAGAVIGGIVALAVLGWVLGLLGVIPGFDSFETYLSSVVGNFGHRY